MNELGCLTPVSYEYAGGESFFHSLVQNYFYFGGRVAFVIPNRTENGHPAVLFSDEKASMMASALKVATWITVVIPIVMLALKIGYYLAYTFHVVDLEEEVGRKLDVAEIWSKLPEGEESITGRREGPHITWHQGQNYVFSLANSPGLIFKYPKYNKGSEYRFEAMKTAKKVCLLHRLDRLVLPRAKMMAVGWRERMIIEEQLEFNPDIAVQKKLFAQLDDETLRQMIIYIAKTNFGDAGFRNTPCLASKQIALLDIDTNDSAKAGILGMSSGNREGLIHCLSDDQVDFVIAEARRQNIDIDSETERSIKEARRLQDAS